MTPAEFKTKWAKVTAKETSAYVEHFNDLCQMLRLPTPWLADPPGSDFFCFQKRVVKDAELFDLENPRRQRAGGTRLCRRVEKGLLRLDSKVIAIAFDDDFHFGVLQSRLHQLWTLATCGWHGIGNDATYNPTECFETFPFPRPTRAQEATIAAAAKELNELRERRLNPPEWTETRTLTFPGSAAGPWARYVDPATADPKTGVGTVRYPRLEPRDADCAAKLKKRTLTNLYNERPAWLDLAHKKLDAAVATAYGFPADLSDEQILERLLALNLDRAAEEAKSAQTTKPAKKAQRGKGEGEML